jgi:exosortase
MKEERSESVAPGETRALRRTRRNEPWQLVLVPFLSLMVISRCFPEVRREKVSGCAGFGLPLMLGGALLNLFGIVLEHPMPSQVGMIAFMQGAVLFVWGKGVYRGLAFPLLYLFLAVPLPRTILVAMTGSLKVIGAAVAEKTLSWVNLPVVRDGAILKFPTFTLAVADECSGLQSLITLSVASLPVAYLMSGRLWKKALIVFLSLPLALVANVVRLDVTAILAHHFGEDLTRSWPHTLIGVVIVFLAFLALYGLSGVLSDRTMAREEAELSEEGG